MFHFRYYEHFSSVILETGFEHVLTRFLGATWSVATSILLSAFVILHEECSLKRRDVMRLVDRGISNTTLPELSAICVGGNSIENLSTISDNSLCSLKRSKLGSSNFDVSIISPMVSIKNGAWFDFQFSASTLSENLKQ